MYGLLQAPKLKYCLFIDKFGIIKEHKPLKGFNDSKQLLDRSQYFYIIDGKKTSDMIPEYFKKNHLKMVLSFL